MTLPVRRDPMREMVSVRQLMDRLMENAFVAPERWSEGGGIETRMDVSETPEAYEVKMAVPGVNPDNINITFENNTLTIRGEVRDETEREDANYHVREIRQGAFSRSLVLPANVDPDTIEARSENGLLILHIPKAEEAKSRKIEVRRTMSGQLSSSDGGEGQSEQPQTEGRQKKGSRQSQNA